MNNLKLVALAALMTFGAAAAQDVAVEKKVEIRIMTSGDGGDDATSVHWVSDDTGFDMEDLAVGESRTLDNESGKTVTVTREEDGFSFNVDGKTITMPVMGPHGPHMAFHGAPGDPMEPGEPLAPGDPVDIDVRIMGAPHHADGVTIISGKPLDDSVKESIRSVLISAGNDEEVIFIDGSDGGRHMTVKKVEILR